ncbi:isopenicillin N synthase family dioxygenase [Pleomorphomonas carboxyditropha]|uniref:2-oxoglutarate-dependent ethylene/succinate-forming enzyme n=1 Tax=Pleomorphomonas carboxyditropha TaxID=2023338 RepID=A0A2G9WT86_9HYPH|nr:2-oxoglutarate and iron-dependent oxygenase domain-containing protein [Pleomorphomonas carboxyditropha]PIO97927.1 2-oxobutyrate oxidase [Pleomorphomonas carboxyditropha]
MTYQPASVTLPFVDISRFRGPAEERTRFIDELRRILYDHGFFYLTGHGVPQPLIDDVLAAARRFFALPVEEKLKVEMINSPHFRGYNRPGWELTRGEKDWREQIDIATEAERLPEDPEKPWNRLTGPNQWPEALPDFKPLILRYQAEVTRVGLEVLKAVSVALGQDEEAFADIYTPLPTQLLKLIRYPGRDVAESSQGVGAHKDGGFVTVLLQDKVGGLRVRTEEGEWIEAPPVPGTFVINTGEVLELATQGYVRADVHDVVTPPAGSERFSVAFFLGARVDSVVPVIELPEEIKDKRRGVTVDALNPIFQDVGRNVLKSRLRSHPDVARRHHADLLTAEERAASGPGSAY